MEGAGRQTGTDQPLTPGDAETSPYLRALVSCWHRDFPQSLPAGTATVRDEPTATGALTGKRRGTLQRSTLTAIRAKAAALSGKTGGDDRNGDLPGRLQLTPV